MRNMSKFFNKITLVALTVAAGLVATVVSAESKKAADKSGVTAMEVTKKNRCKFDITRMRGTQLFIGKEEVRVDLEEWREEGLLKPENRDELKAEIKKKPVVVVMGPALSQEMHDALADEGLALAMEPNQELEPIPFIIDRHHHDLLALQAGSDKEWGGVLHDWSKLPWDQFWKKMFLYDFVYKYDANGDGPLTYEQMEERGIFKKLMSMQISELIDDPYRAIAGLLYKRGIITKPTHILPFWQFDWARWLKANMTVDPRVDGYEAAMKEAKKLAQSDEASHLPGWLGKKPKEKK